MKNIPYAFIFFMIYNLSFSQEKTENPNAENDITKFIVFKFYPNPVEDELFVIGTNKIKSIEFINILGKRAALYHFNKSIIKMNVSQLKSGIYLIQVVDENNKQETKRLVVK